MKIKKEKKRWIIEPLTAIDYLIAELLMEGLKAIDRKRKKKLEETRNV